jgi:hypothetical protein
MVAKRIAALVVMSIGSIVSVDAQLGDQGLVRWEVIVPDSLPFDAGYRSFVERRTLRIRFLVDNESVSPIQIDQVKLRDALSLTVVNSEGAEIPTTLEWIPEIRLSTADAPTTSDLVSPVVVEPMSTAGWSLIVERSDGQSFSAGPYGILPTTSGFPGAIATAGGQPWQGRARDASGRIVLVVMSPRDAHEVSMTYLESGLKAMRENHPLRAAEDYERAVATDPTNTEALWFLGGAYLALQQYQQAISTYEQLLKRSSSSAEAVEAVARRLAFTYVAAGDEVNAARVLRSAGVPEEAMPAALDELRTTGPTPTPTPLK